MKASPKKSKKVERVGKPTKPVKHAGAAAQTVRRKQVAALPYRQTLDGRIEFLLMTSRETGRFVIPKGWPMKHLKDCDAAAREAYEEAGIVGIIKRKPIGNFVYWKRLEDHFGLVTIDVYPLKVRRQCADWPEKGSRHYGWVSPENAAILVDEPGLMTLLTTFRP